MTTISEYQQEQLEALVQVKNAWRGFSQSRQARLHEAIKDYLDFRAQVSRFLNTHFSAICNQACFQSRVSACCSKDGIITFFGDVVVNMAVSTPAEIAALEQRLKQTNQGHRCIYLDLQGCMWRVKPVVCEMFLCDRAQQTVFEADAVLKKEWQAFERRRKDFTWPDKPVLFDRLEQIFMELGLRSALMYLHNSPGLLRIKKQARKLQSNNRAKTEIPNAKVGS